MSRCDIKEERNELTINDAVHGCTEYIQNEPSQVCRLHRNVYQIRHKNAPFVCIEPWYGRCDKEGFEGELSEREYEQIIKPEGDFRAKYTVTFG